MAKKKRARTATGRFTKKAAKKRNPANPKKRRATRRNAANPYKKKARKRRNPSRASLVGAQGVKHLTEAGLFLGGFAVAHAVQKLVMPAVTGYMRAGVQAAGGVGVGILYRMFAKTQRMKNFADYVITGGVAAGIVAAVDEFTKGKFKPYYELSGMGAGASYVPDMMDYRYYRNLPEGGMSDYRYMRDVQTAPAADSFATNW